MGYCQAVVYSSGCGCEIRRPIQTVFDIELFPINFEKAKYT